MWTLVFTVSGAEAKPVRAVTLPEIGLSERQHLQEWGLAHPEILGPGIKVVTFEFDRWWAAEAILSTGWTCLVWTGPVG